LEGEKKRNDKPGLFRPTKKKLRRKHVKKKKQWRETKDGYDLAGEKPGLFGQIGNFLGGTADARKDVAALGFQDVYLLQEYTVNGYACRILKCYPNPNWRTYMIDEEKTEPMLLGEQAGRPTYQDIAKLLESQGIPAKWARDMGIKGGAPPAI
jgi:hypothetical protein